MREKINVGDYYKWTVKAALWMIVITVGFAFFIFPNEETNTIMKTADNDFGLTSQTFYKNCYQDLLKNGNVVAGNMFFSTETIRFYYDNKDTAEDGDPISYTALDIHDHKYWAAKNLPGPASLIDNYWIYVEDEDIFITKTYSEEYYSFSYDRDSYTHYRDEFSYSQVMELLEKQKDGEIKLKELAALISLTKDNILLNYDGKTAVFAEFISPEGDSREVKFIVTDADGNEESYGPFACSKEVPVMSVNGLFIWAYGNEVHIYDYEEDEEEIVDGNQTGGTVLSLNYSVDKSKTDIMFLTEGKVHYLDSYGKKYEISKGECNETSAIIYADYYKRTENALALWESDGKFSCGNFSK